MALLKDNDKDLIDYVDTRITDIFLRAMTNNETPCLPVHDSYIVKESDKNFLIEVMKESYEYIMLTFSFISTEMNSNERKIGGMSAGSEKKFYGCKVRQFRVKDCICNPSPITGIGVYALQNWCTVYLNPYR